MSTAWESCEVAQLSLARSKSDADATKAPSTQQESPPEGKARQASGFTHSYTTRCGIQVGV